MPNASNLTPDKRFLALFVGDSGSGKTVAEASFPKEPNGLHILDFDGRIRGLLGAPWIDRSKITYDYFQPRDPSLIETLNKKLEGWLTAAKVGQPIPTTLITDSLTTECYAMIRQSLPLTHVSGKGRSIGPIAMLGPEDYGFESQAINDYVSFLKTLYIPNIIVSAHYVDKFEKPKDEKGNVLTYADSIVVGKKLSIRDKIGTNVKVNFDHIFEFERRIVDGHETFWVTFRGELARTSYDFLPEGSHNWTGKNFYEFMMSFRKKEVKNV